MQRFYFILLFLFTFLVELDTHAQTNPISSISGLELWFSGDSALVPNNTSISTWNDLSGNNNNGSQAVAINQPLKIDSISLLNNHSVLRFNGNNSFNLTSGINLSSATVFFVAQNNDNVAGSVIMGQTSDWFNNFFIADGLIKFWTTSQNVGLNMPTLNNYLFGRFVYNGSTASAYGNGTYQATGNLTGNFAPNEIGSYTNDPSYAMDGDIAEIIIYNRALTASETNIVENYIYNKYAPPVNLGNDITVSNFCPFVLKSRTGFTRYAWNNNASLNTNQLTVDSSGTYTIEAEDIFGRISYDTVIVTFPPVNTIANNSPFCQGDSLMWNTSLPKNLFSFLWSNNSTDSLLWITQPGQYSVRITDTSGCFFDSDVISVTQDNFASIASLGPDTFLCAGNTITLVNGNQPGITYLWNDNSTNDALIIVSSGVYSVTATNSNNCVAIDNINVTIVGQAPIIGFTNSTPCVNNSISFTDTSFALSGNTITQWLWDFGDPSTTLDVANVSQPNYTYADTGLYTINLTVTSNVGCQQTLNKTIHIYPKPIVDFTNSIACQNDTAFFNDVINPLGYPTATYQWNFGDVGSGTNNTSSSSDPYHIFSQNTNYLVQLIATNNQGCVNSITKTVKVFDCQPNPISLIPGLELWFSGDSALVPNNNNVGAWNDLSGNNNNGSQSAALNQPIKIDSISLLNNHSVLRFNGNNSFNLTSAVNLSSATVFFVAQNNDNAAGSVIMGQTSDWFNTFFIANGYIKLSTNTQNITLNMPTLNNYIFGRFVYNGSTATAYGNETYQTTTTLTGNFSANEIGSYTNDPSYSMDGDIAEIIIYNRALTVSEANIVENYIYNKYAPPVSLGNDTSLNSFCPFLLKVKNNFTKYIWNNNASLNSNQLIIDSSGTFTIETEDIFGRHSFDTITVSFPDVNTIVNNSLFCQGDSLIWNTNLPNNLFSFQWSNNSTDSLIWISQPGIYFVNVTDTSGCFFDSDVISITQDNFSSIASLGSDTSLCSGNTITLVSGNQAGVTYQWNDNSTNNSLTINSSGQYWITATNLNNCIAYDTINLVILGQAPIAGFQNGLTCLNNSIAFNDTSIASSGNIITQWLWDFGDPSTTLDVSNVSQPNYTYSDTGFYTINLTVTTDVGCKQNLSKNIHVYPSPIVDFTNTISCQNDSTFFNDVINILSYPITSYQWNFGDAISGANNTSASSDPFHIFSQNTNYQVQLIATNNQGCSDVVTKTIIIKDEVSADFNYSNACINVPITFTDNSIAPSPNVSNTRNWSFFPGTAAGLTATKTYSTSGAHNVTLKVTGFNGCVSSITKQIQVSLPPDADFTSSMICIADSFQLTDSSLPINGNINSWQWKYAGNTFSNLQNPKFLLNTSGSANVFLRVTNDSGCVDSITKIVFVNPLPNANFDIGPSAYLFVDSPVSFTPNQSSALNYFWTLSNGNTFNDPILTLSFTNESTYTIGLLLTDNFGCKNNSTQTFTIERRNTDLGIIAARSTIDNDGFVGVEADLFNYGSTPITKFEILYELTGGGIMKETWATDTLSPGAILLFKFSANSFLSINERENAISCIKILTVNNSIDDNIANNENCAALNSNKQLVAEPFPNPADGDVSLPIVLTEDQTILITVYDYLGKLIVENLTYDGVTGLNFIKIPSASYSSGTYTLKISISDSNYIRKLIKQGSTK